MHYHDATRIGPKATVETTDGQVGRVVGIVDSGFTRYFTLAMDGGFFADYPHTDIARVASDGRRVA